MPEYLAPGVYVEELASNNIKSSFEDIPLPASEITKLKNVSDSALIQTKGLTTLFTGAYGTGKTLAAEVVAKTTGWPLYRIDLSLIVNKYIGETEKNLDKLFEQANNAEAVLFFDEADALFGKRTEVKDAHDRFANSEVSYLLQKIESFDGVVILVTNLTENIDDEMLKILHSIIKFPLPEPPRPLNNWLRLWDWLKRRIKGGK